MVLIVILTYACLFCLLRIVYCFLITMIFWQEERIKIFQNEGR